MQASRSSCATRCERLESRRQFIIELLGATPSRSSDCHHIEQHQRQPHNRTLLGLDLPLMLKLPLDVLGTCDCTRSPSIVQEDTLAPSSALAAQWSQREISPFRTFRSQSVA